MKFTKEDACKELVSRMTAKGEKLNLSERSINEQLDTLMAIVVNDETELADFIDRTLPLFKTADANVRNDVSVGIAKYKENNPTPPAPANPQPQQTGVDDDKNELLTRLEAIELELANAKREEQVRSLHNDISMRLRSKGVKDEEWVNALLSEVTISDNVDVDAKVESYLNLYNKSHARIERNATPQGANGGNGDTYIKDIIKKAGEKAKSQRFGAE